MAGKQKVWWWGLGFGHWLDGKLNGEGIQFIGSSWAKKSDDCCEIENLCCVVVRLFVQMYRHFEIVVLLNGELDFVYDLVLNLQYLQVLNFENFVVLVIIADYDLDLVIVVLWVMCLCGVVICHMYLVWLIFFYCILLFVLSLGLSSLM